MNPDDTPQRLGTHQRLRPNTVHLCGEDALVLGAVKTGKSGGGGAAKPRCPTQLDCLPQKRFCVSTKTVTGPSLTSATCIAAWKRPVTTVTPSASATLTTSATSGSATSG